MVLKKGYLSGAFLYDLKQVQGKTFFFIVCLGRDITITVLHHFCAAF